jgi:hypothetical protein
MSMKKKTHYILIGDYGCNEKIIKNAHMKKKLLQLKSEFNK